MDTSRLYFVQLFRYSRWAGIVVAVFFFLNFAANFISPTQITPIYNWNLYAFPIKPQPSYSFLDIRYNNNQPLDIQRTWREPQRLILTNTMAKYISRKVDKNPSWIEAHFVDNWKPAHPWFVQRFPNFRNEVDEEELNAFPQWFNGYLERYTGVPVDSVKVYRRQLYYTRAGAVQVQASRLIYAY